MSLSGVKGGRAGFGNLEDYVTLDDPEVVPVDRHDRTVPAQVLAPPRRLGVAGGLMTAIRQPHVGV